MTDRAAFDTWASQWGGDLGLHHLDLEGLWLAYVEGRRHEREANDVPAGWMLVPIEPTEEMLDAACEVDARRQVERKNLVRFPGLMPHASAGDVWRIQYQAALAAIRSRSVVKDGLTPREVQG